MHRSTAIWAADPTPIPWAVLGPALIALAGTLVVAGFGVWQFVRGQRQQRRLEREKLRHEQDKLDWEREKLRLTRDDDRAAKREDTAEQRRREAADTERERRNAAIRQAHTREELSALYCQALQADLRDLRILDMRQPMDLDRIYVQVSVTEERSGTPAEDESRMLAELDADGRREPRPRRTAVEHQTLAPHDALAQHRRIVVLGDPGAGKTTMLRHLAVRAARGDDDSGSFPVYIELRAFVDSGIEDLVAYAVTALANDFGFVDATDHVEQQLRDGNGPWLLDGLDEVLGGATPEEATAAYDRVSAQINRLARRYPRLPIAVTCRRAGWRPTLHAFTGLDVLDFSADQINEFIGHWFTGHPGLADQLRRALSANARMQNLATNPLLLSLIAMVFERQLELPERRAELYSRCADVMLHEWDSHRGIRRYTRFTTDHKRGLLLEVAWHFHAAGQRYFREQELLDVIGEFLPTVGLPAAGAPDILREIDSQYGLLKEQAPGWYGFLHLTMQEYFAARAATGRGPAAVDLVLAHRHDPWWEEVLLLLSGLLNDAGPLILGVLGRRPGHRRRRGPLARNDDLFHGDLLLATRCLTGSPRITEPGLRKEVLTEVDSLLEGTTSTLVADRAAAALSEIGSPESLAILEHRVAHGEESPGALAAIRALCARPDTRATTLALQLLPEIKQTRRFSAALTAVATSRNADVVPALLAMLDERATDELVRGDIIAALRDIGDRSAIPALLRELPARSSPNLYFPPQVLTALRAFQVREAVPRLRELLLPSPVTIEDAIAETIAALGSAEDLQFVIDVHLQRIPTPGTELIGSVLRDIRHPDLVGIALPLLNDEDVPWQKRWPLVQAVDANGASTEDLLLAYRRAAARTPEIAAALAAVLAQRGDPSMLPTLRKAIEDGGVPGDTILPEQTYPPPAGECHVLICQGLHHWRDESAVATLLSRWSATPGTPDHKAAVNALPVFRSDRIAQHVIDDLRRAVGLRSVNRRPLFSQDELHRFITASTAGAALRLVVNRRAVHLSTQGLRSLVEAVGQVGTTPETARLLDRLRDHRAPNEFDFVIFGNRRTIAELVDEAVDAVCRRGRFRLHADGRVTSLDGRRDSWWRRFRR